MSYDYAVHSDFLIHWTGKDIDAEHQPTWYDDDHRSNTVSDVVDRYLHRLRHILTYRLWMTDGGFGGQRELEIYDPAADRWDRGAAIPRALHHAGAAGLDGKLYVVGGYADGWTPTDGVYEYGPAADRWRARPPADAARRAGSRGPGWQDSRGRRRRRGPAQHPGA